MSNPWGQICARKFGMSRHDLNRLENHVAEVIDYHTDILNNFPTENELQFMSKNQIMKLDRLRKERKQRLDVVGNDFNDFFRQYKLDIKKRAFKKISNHHIRLSFLLHALKVAEYNCSDYYRAIDAMNVSKN